MNQIPTPAQLFVGPHEHLIDHAKQYLKTLFCKNNACHTCTTCRQIDEEQFHSTLWFEPENQYKREQLEPIFKTIQLALEPEQQFFFILQKSDCLTTACANSLLKSVEEPPAGYNFIFLTEREQRVLPTIRSRCATHLFYDQKDQTSDHFLQIFQNATVCSPSVFLSALAEKNPGEQKTASILDALLVHWIAEKKKNLDSKNNAASKIIALIKTALKNPPMPGSSKIFWKNFYLQLKKL